MWRRLLAVLLLVLILLAARGAWRVAAKADEASLLKVEEQAKLEELTKREQELRAGIADLRGEQGIEAELRERYDLAREGEGVIIILDPPSEPPPPPPSRMERFKGWFSW